MVALEDAFQTRLDEQAFSGAHDVGQLRALVEEASTGEVEPTEAAGVPGLEPIAGGANGPSRRAAGVHPAARARVRLDPGRWTRAPGSDSKGR